MNRAHPSTQTRVFTAVALGALAVALQVLAQPPSPVWPLSLVMLGPLALFAETRRPRAVFVFAHLTSAAMALVIVRWLIHALSIEYGVARPAAWAFSVLLVGSYALIPAAVAAVYAAVSDRLHDATAPLAFAALWTLGEWLRAEPLALPWVLAAHPLAFVPAAIQTADLGGVWAPGFGIALAGGGLGVAVARRRWVPLVPALVFLIGAAGWTAGVSVESGPPLRVAAVQMSVPQNQRFQPGSALRNSLRHVDATREFLAGDRADLVVWSETAVDDDIDVDPRLAARLQDLVEQTGVPLVTGAPRAGRGSRRNSVVRFAPGISPRFYDKQRLVPFSESEPRWLDWVAPLVAPLTEGDAYVPGAGPALLPLPIQGQSVGTPICFEITYPHLVRAFRREGADVILNLSNDAWFGRTGFAETHLAHVPFRAVELRTWIVRATNTGISAVVDPRGRIVSRLGLFEEDVLVADVEGAGALGVYARWGDAPILILLALVLAGSFLPRRAQGAGDSPRS
jgi:apolipoprotein N-acyltransferase